MSSSPTLQTSYTRTDAGDGELAAPSNGLSINQRKLLQWADGKVSLADMADRLAAGHTVDTGKVARDLERLQAMGLVASNDSDAGAPAAMPMSAGYGKKKSKAPLLIGGVGLVVLAGGLFAVFGGSAGPAPATTAASGGSAAAQQVAQDDTQTQSSGIMPNPARWFSPSAPKPETPPAPAANAKDAKHPATPPASVAPAAAKPQLAAATPAAVAPLPAAVVPAPAPTQVAAATPATTNAIKAAQAVAAPALSVPVQAAPVQVASTQPILPKQAEPALVAPNTKPIYRVQPDFPVDAMRSHIDAGSVHARISVDEKGQVTRVDVLSAKPSPVFNRSVVAALSKWRFQPASTHFTVETDIEFHNAD